MKMALMVRTFQRKMRDVLTKIRHMGWGTKEGHPLIKAKRDATIVTSWNIFLFEPGFFVIFVFQLVRFRYFTIIFDQILSFYIFFSECPVEKARMIWPAWHLIWRDRESPKSCLHHELHLANLDTALFLGYFENVALFLEIHISQAVQRGDVHSRGGM